MFIKLTKERSHKALYVDVSKIRYFSELECPGELDGKTLIQLDNFGESYHVTETCDEINNQINSLKESYQ